MIYHPLSSTVWLLRLYTSRSTSFNKKSLPWSFSLKMSQLSTLTRASNVLTCWKRRWHSRLQVLQLLPPGFSCPISWRWTGRLEGFWHKLQIAGFLSHGGTSVLIHFRLGVSMKSHPAFLGCPHFWETSNWTGDAADARNSGCNWWKNVNKSCLPTEKGRSSSTNSFREDRHADRPVSQLLWRVKGCEDWPIWQPGTCTHGLTTIILSWRSGVWASLSSQAVPRWCGAFLGHRSYCALPFGSKHCEGTLSPKSYPNTY